MKTFTKALTNGVISTVAAGAMVLSTASPAVARDNHRDHDGISAGEIIAGALVIGGIAAIASAASNDRDRYGYEYGRAGYGGYDRYGRYDHDGYGRGYVAPRQAVSMCVSAVTRSAARYSHGRAHVTDIRDIDRNRDGYTVRGRIAVNGRGHGWHSRDADYGRGWNNDYRGWNSGLRGYDSGSFKCKVRYGRVVDVDFSGIRGL